MKPPHCIPASPRRNNRRATSCEVMSTCECEPNGPALSFGVWLPIRFFRRLRMQRSGVWHRIWHAQGRQPHAPSMSLPRAARVDFTGTLGCQVYRSASKSLLESRCLLRLQSNSLRLFCVLESALLCTPIPQPNLKGAR